MDYEGKKACTQNINKYHFDQQILVVGDSNELRLLVENEGQNWDDQKILWQLSEKMDQKFYEKFRKIDIPPPMKNLKNGTFFISHGLCDGVVIKCVQYFHNDVENGSKSRISQILVVGESNELLDKKWSQHFVMTCSDVVYTILCANSKDVFSSKMKAKIGMTKKL
ncbi:hypothetical protein PFMG_04568 [Plasmodium falciparum IGH-CR14]|uniref:Uncharacterized protein n=1 Tax=Plasmodium falciparum IGH-CR14 TaxID=580059 RepID=A0A0L1IFR3_PLAFA|nr:hypothetical protein PFMG_04568 [Plasmodium falciparum IGH-CR14]